MTPPDPERVTRSETALVGIGVRTDNHREMDPQTAQIGGLWERVFAEDVLSRIPHASDDQTIVAAYTEYETDASGPYTLIVGKEVSATDDLADGFHHAVAPAGAYLRFRATGEMPQAVVETWQAIWTYFQNSAIRRAYQVDLEIHRTLPSGETSVEIDIGIVADA